MKATVYCRMNALRAYDKEKVLISIGSYGYQYEPVAHLDDWFDILVVAFDDILPGEEITFEDEALVKLMDIDQAIEIDNFIQKYLDKDFVIHCDAGRSRSTAVASYMTKYYNCEVEYYETGDIKDDQKNIHVYNLLGRLNYHSAFGDIE